MLVPIDSSVVQSTYVPGVIACWEVTWRDVGVGEGGCDVGGDLRERGSREGNRMVG